MCANCYSKETTIGKTIFAVECDGCTIVVRNVPCIICSHCGSESFSYDVSKQLSDIVKEARKEHKEMFVVDYETHKAA